MDAPSIRDGFALLAAAAAFGCSSESLSGSSSGGSAPPEQIGAPGAATEALYPSGPYGHGVGATIDNLSFLGWHHPDANNYDTKQLEMVKLSDFYNPGGSVSDVKLLVFNVSAVWCTVCRSEYGHLENADVYQQYRQKGVEILGVLFQDRDYNPAKPSDLVVWGGPNSFDVKFPLVIDPGFKSGVYFSSDATPLNMIVDATTMEILDVTMGYDTTNPASYWAGVDRWLSGN